MAVEVRIYPHNDLSNLAHYHLQILEEKARKGTGEGMKLDCMSCLIALAFSVEALLNFVGSKRVTGWNEGDSYAKKLKAIHTAIDLPLATDREPLRTLDVLKTMRNQMAHGKPIETRVQVVSKDDLTSVMTTSWDGYLDPAFCRRAFDQYRAYKDSLFEAGQIRLAESLTSAFGGLDSFK